ncbi:MAG: helix-hairpin-helix domain-containing protein [Christensenellales bacterium]
MLPDRSPALYLVQRIRDEAHRFAISAHRKARAKKSFKSSLEEIPGIGPVRRRALLAKFRNMDAIKNASVEELLSVKGMNEPAARALYDAFHS